MKQTVNTNLSYFRTTDLGLVSAISLYIPFDAIDRKNPRKAVFEFSESEKLRGLVDQYYKNELRVDPARYFQQLTLIKGRLYSDS